LFSRNGEKWQQVCAKGWNETWGHLACTQLGQFGDGSVSVDTPTSGGSGFFRLNSSIVPETVLFVQSAAANVPADSCDKTVQLKCQKFGESSREKQQNAFQHFIVMKQPTLVESNEMNCLN
jgi:hypothetical protein